LIRRGKRSFVNALTGKVAGVQVVQSATGIGGSARITIRGESSLNLNNNSPLFVVDGIPITNQNPAYGGASVDFGGGDIPHDFGNAAAEINPDDVASITVLKGPNAAALYGARAANGAILITTKSGKKAQGFGVSVNSGVTFERALRLPDYQNVYGGGLNPDAYTLYDVPPANPLQAGNSGGYSWGPRMNGQLFKQFGSPLLPNNDREPIPFLPRPDNVSNFFQTGITSNQNIALAYGGENASLRLSYTRLDQTGIVPNTDLKRNYLALNAGAQLHRLLRVDAALNYANSGSNNLPTSGYGPASHMYNFLWEERNADLNWYRNYWVPGQEGIQQRNNLTFADNIYFMTYETISPFDKNRVYGNVRASLDITDRLMLQLRSGIDTYSEVRRTRKAFSALRRPQGMYRFQEVAFTENNSDFLLRYRPKMDDLFSLETSLGGNIMHQSNRVATATNVALAIPGVYNIGNAESPSQLDESDQKKSIYSLYALAQIGFRKFLFMDITARNDWSSTLPKGNNAYFYPSVGLSGNITEVADLAKVGISFLKLRASWAQVGKDTDPYQLQQFYNYSLPWGGNAAVTNRSVIANAGLKPEITTSYEFGTDLRFFSDRIGIDFTLYNIRSRN
jgi:TonB-linked SusC/RagA family outer membrane protein